VGSVLKGAIAGLLAAASVARGVPASAALRGAYTPPPVIPSVDGVLLADNGDYLTADNGDYLTF
jgi:hypothetical protein